MATSPEAPADPGAAVRIGEHRASRPPAMTDVAAHAGVSAQTVSRVLNGHPNVARRTRTLVEAAVAELGYRRNMSARALATGRSNVLGVVAMSTALYGPSAILEAVGVAAAEADMPLSVAHVVRYTPAGTAQIVQRMLDQSVAGVICISSMDSAAEVLDALPDTLPVVTVGGPRMAGLPNVSVDQAGGARLATRHLLAMGHRTVWHLAGPEPYTDARDRERGWRRTLQEAGVEEPPLLRGDWSAASGARAAAILSRVRDCTAVFAANDQVALGLVHGLTALGRRVPEDISVVGFDDIPEAEYLSPALTTVRQEFAEVGSASVRLLMDQLTAGRRIGATVRIDAQLVERGSVARVASRV